MANTWKETKKAVSASSRRVMEKIETLSDLERDQIWNDYQDGNSVTRRQLEVMAQAVGLWRALFGKH